MTRNSFNHSNLLKYLHSIATQNLIYISYTINESFSVIMYHQLLAKTVYSCLFFSWLHLILFCTYQFYAYYQFCVCYQFYFAFGIIFAPVINLVSWNTCNANDNLEFVGINFNSINSNCIRTLTDYMKNIVCYYLQCHPTLWPSFSFAVLKNEK